MNICKQASQVKREQKKFDAKWLCYPRSYTLGRGKMNLFPFLSLEYIQGEKSRIPLPPLSNRSKDCPHSALMPPK